MNQNDAVLGGDKESLIYRFIAKAVFMLIVIYLIVGQVILGLGLHEKQNDLSSTVFFVGQTTLHSPLDLQINLKQDVEKLELYFSTEPFEIDSSPANIFVTPLLELNKVSLKFDDERLREDIQLHTEIITTNNNALSSLIEEGAVSSLSQKRRFDIVKELIGFHEKEIERLIKKYRHIRLSLQPSSDERADVLLVNRVRINEEDVPLGTFMNDYVEQKTSNISFHSPRQFKNLSRYLALSFGDNILTVIQFVLFTFFSIQLFLFLIGVIWCPPIISDIFSTENLGRTATWIDNFSIRHAIPLGFLGTVLSLWIAVETNVAGFKNFDAIFSIFKVAIFTTALALAISLICIVRGYKLSLTHRVLQWRNDRKIS